MATLLNDKQLAFVSRKCTQRKREKRYGSDAEIVQALTVSRKRPVLKLIAFSIFVVLIVVGFVYRPVLPATQSELYPVYGNQVISEQCERVLVAECLRLLHSSDSLFDRKAWTEDSLRLMLRLKETFDSDYPLQEQRQTAMYKKQWENLQKEAERQLQRVLQHIQQD